MPKSPVTTYAIPSELQLGYAGSGADQEAKKSRVQQQVHLRMAEKFSNTLPQMNRTASYAATDYGNSTSMKYATYKPSFTTKSQMVSANQTINRTPQYSSRSMVEMDAQGGSNFYQKRAGTLSSASMRLQGQSPGSALMNIDFINGNVGYDSGTTLQRQSAYGDTGFSMQSAKSGQMKTMQRSLSGTLIGSGMANGNIGGGTIGGGNFGGGTIGGGNIGGGTIGGMEQTHQYSFKGPAYRTLTRINRVSRPGPPPGQQISSGGTIQRYSEGFTNHVGQTVVTPPILMQQQHSGCSLPRSGSMKSITSLKGADVFDGAMDGVDNGPGFTGLDMDTAVSYLNVSEPEVQVQGAAFIQHECYHKDQAKTKLRELKGIPALVKLLTSPDLEVQRYATGAMRNAIYENMENKAALLEAGGIPRMVEALNEPDSDLRKNITGILWNLSSKDNLKEKVAKDTLSPLTEKILVPLSAGNVSEDSQQSASDVEIFCNTTGCLRNLSSLNEKTRQQMRDTPGLVDSLVGYIQGCLQDDSVNGKGVENSICVLRNLSYQVYSEMQPSTLRRLEGPSRSEDRNINPVISCFTPQSRKAKNALSSDVSFTEVAKQPKGQEWLWHPQVVPLYNGLLEKCQESSTTREAAAGALHNITGGDQRWASVLSRVALDREHSLLILVDRLRSTSSDQELRSITGLLRNLTRQCGSKDTMVTKLVSPLVTRLPNDGRQKEPSSEVVINICGALNNMVAVSSNAAREITYFDGLQKLMAIKDSNDGSSAKMKTAKSASTVLGNMFQYKKLHKDYKDKGFNRTDFAETTM
ncbi:plakophilin-3-like isoform X2 [Brienomyrus brachyistius]|uniref:plakophilin-3-like isoform X2 n=1 Tax=Brienomyrus brachyistius TaxID=42636 RepID=UPI0020B42333|nr:plakophilin-3-like isoform X2 [Brienomyrus brachyistius]